MDNNKALHAAIAALDIENLDRLLNHPDIDVNYINDEGKTPLLASINKEFGSTMALSLIRAGCNIHCTDLDGSTPLHKAIDNDLIVVAHELILRSAFLNVRDGCKNTPLSKAILNGNLEAVCLLLYYQADVNTNFPNTDVLDFNTEVDDDDYFIGTHLMRAVKTNRNDICEVLLDYCNDISYETIEGETAFSIAVSNQNPLVLDLKRGADVNTMDFFDTPIDYAMQRGNIEIFSLIWSQLDYETLLDGLPFLHTYIEDCNFSNSEWLECLHLILKTPVAPTLLKHTHDEEHFDCFSEVSFSSILELEIAQREIEANILWKYELEFLCREIELKDRICLTYIFLSLGVEIIANDLQFMWLLFGPNDEFEAVVYTGDLSYNDYREQMHLLFKEPFHSTIPVDLINCFAQKLIKDLIL